MKLKRNGVRNIGAMHVPESVFVSSTSSPEEAMLSRGYSGILVAKNWVLAHGSMLASVLSRSQEFVDTITSMITADLIMIPGSDPLFDDLTFSVYRDRSVEGSGRIVSLWKCPLLENALENTVRDWTFEYFDRLLLPIFMVIQVTPRTGGREQTKANKAEVEGVLRQLAKQAASLKPVKGATVELVSTPFGNAFFIDSVSRGIVGNLLGINKCLILMDLTAFPGCEGAPVFLINDRGDKSICGMIIASLSRCRGEWVNYTFAVNLLPSLKLILQSRTPKDESRYSTCSTFSFSRWNRLNIDSLERNIAIVKCGPNWGTGILVDEQSGTFITCAHVVRTASATRIELTNGNIASRNSGSKWSVRANLIYIAEVDEPYDIAVLRIDPRSRNPWMRAIKFARTPVCPGEQILSIGFPFYSTNNPVISGGTVTKTSRYMFQTNCSAYSGVSGGPIVRRDNLEMLGMIVCSFASMDESTSYPRLCMAIPITVLKEPLADYLRTSDPKTLLKLTQHDANAATTWNLRPFLPSKM